ncbi:MAG: DEAD/DEAH box helicase family protein [Akkermansiaceae bacterium]|nr:DEAD/DEAH box helicase family protein [Akkermansiaceae bacterium]MCP5544267.1 DEAD/DEAH box helicase family protein [Akkermansiaceae bacterium]
MEVIPAALKKGDFSGTLRCVRRAQVEIPTDGLPASLVAALKRLGTLANPVFFEKQRLRFGTWNIPRFIFSGEIHADRLVLPRGTIRSVEELVRKAGGSLEIDDHRPASGGIEVSFHGELSEEQRNAVDAMMLHDDGVLLAPPGAGKTVMACAIIAGRRVPTLVLVHRKALMEQWRARLGRFLGLEKRQIATLSPDGVPPDAPVTLGMLQTLAKSPAPGALLAPFSQVIIDECHHVPAASFEAVMKECAARHVVGLTATPTRKDGLQKILFLQCGPVRHRIDNTGDRSVGRTVILHDIHLDLPPDDLRMPVHQLWELLATHEVRNEAIRGDIAAALEEDRRCLVLSDRREHLAALEALLTADERMAARVFRMDGSMGKKARRTVFAEIDKCIGEGNGFALLATSSLVGEGFDLPELDTLFLTLPVSFKGRIIQYAGRLHRAVEGKAEVRIHDYAEPEHPLTSSMRRKRMVAYREMSYRTADDDALLP